MRAPRRPSSSPPSSAPRSTHDAASAQHVHFDERTVRISRKPRVAAIVHDIDGDEDTHKRASASAHSREESRVLNIDERLREKKHHSRVQRTVRILIAVATACVIGVLVWLVFFSSLLTLSPSRTVVTGVDGTSLIEKASVNSILTEYEAERLIFLSESDIEHKLEGIPEIKSAYVHIKFPRTLVVDLVSEQVVACLVSGSQCMPVASDGAELVSKAAADVVAGDGAILRLKVDAAHENTQNAVAKALNVLESLDSSVRSRVVEVDVSKADYFTLILDNGASVQWGTGADSETKNSVLLVLLQEDHTMYDVSIPGSPTTR